MEWRIVGLYAAVVLDGFCVYGVLVSGFNCRMIK